ncbi:MAG: ROK family protein [Verrucomicrobiae bacterium]|nr:ROK family protein [Verrucomicrobiae bacterium]
MATTKRTRKKNSFYAGLDIGGSTIKAMLVDGAGEQVGKIVEVRSLASQGHRKTFGQLKKALKSLCKNAKITEADVAAIGMDVPAPCSNGVIWDKANMASDWLGVNVRDTFAKVIKKPVYMTNDCNAAAFGEYLLRPWTTSGLLYAAPGTGLGGGLVLAGGMVFEGANGLAMELGDITIPFREGGKMPVDASGREGALEAWVSLVALRRQLALQLKKKKYAKHPLNDPKIPIEERAFKVRNYAEGGDALALEIFGIQARALGYALGDAASLFDPGLIVIGGGMAETKPHFRDWYIESIRSGFRERAEKCYQFSPLEPERATTTIEWAIGGDAAAAYGAAMKGRELVV